MGNNAGKDHSRYLEKKGITSTRQYTKSGKYRDLNPIKEFNSIKLIRTGGQSSMVNSKESSPSQQPLLDRMKFDRNNRPLRVPSWKNLDQIVREEFPEMNPDEFVVDEVEKKHEDGYRRDLGQMLKVMAEYKRTYGFKLAGFRPFTSADMELVSRHYVDELGQDAADYSDIPSFGIFTEDPEELEGMRTDQHFLVYNPKLLPHRDYEADEQKGNASRRQWAEIFCPEAEMSPSARQTYRIQLKKLRDFRMDAVDGTAKRDSRFWSLSKRECQYLQRQYEKQLRFCGDSDADVSGSHLDPVRNLNCSVAHEMGHMVILDRGFADEKYESIIEKLKKIAPPTEYAKVDGDEKFAELMAYAAMGNSNLEFSDLLTEFELPTAPTNLIRFDVS